MSTGHYIKGVKDHVDGLPKIPPKNPFLSAVVGFFFGPIGIGIYFKSFTDFFWCFVFLIGLFILIPGLGIVPGWLFSAVYGGYRAHSSNQK
ncbi:hypothetical protein IM793_13205 [Pedobacter sp. MR2016-19]|uniref:hypothetical protein n=1 Tax=Pedobacter sp. MR2016-19 TaxID=2780089 RepID=UPI001876A2D2|nr:hypothetical protein [Pedobacter sp. MR2016-19]MBE5320119.1 hypothetical protein [Pedobacter sp. MR2016-19]